MVFAGLAGKSTYSKAVRVTTEYAEAANKASNNTGKVTEKVEELKRSLAGLDEITIIGQNLSPVSAAMGGNDAVSNSLDYGSMFVEAPVDMAKVNEIKEKFERILLVVLFAFLVLLFDYNISRFETRNKDKLLLGLKLVYYILGN